MIRKVGGLVYLRRRGRTLPAGEASRLVNIPADMRPRYDHVAMFYIDGSHLGGGFVYTSGTRAGQLWLAGHSVAIAAGRVVYLSTTWPAA